MKTESERERERECVCGPKLCNKRCEALPRPPDSMLDSASTLRSKSVCVPTAPGILGMFPCESSMGQSQNLAACGRARAARAKEDVPPVGSSSEKYWRTRFPGTRPGDQRPRMGPARV